MSGIPLSYEPSDGDTHKQVVDELPPDVVQCLTNARFWPVIVMTTNISSRKTTHITANPNVSILVHDWVSARLPTQGHTHTSSQTSESPSNLAQFLWNMNSAAISSISATIGGVARLAPPGSAEKKYYLKKHLEKHNKDATLRNGVHNAESPLSNQSVTGQDVRVIVADIKDVRISDNKGTVYDLELKPPLHSNLPSNEGV